MKPSTNSIRVLLIAAITLIVSSSPAANAAAESALPEAGVGVRYECRLSVENGTPPFTWRLVEGELPPGIQLSSTGALQGVVTSQSNRQYRFNLEVSDSSTPRPAVVSQWFSISVRPPLRIVVPGNESSQAEPSGIRIVAAHTPTREEVTKPAITKATAGERAIEGIIQPAAGMGLVEILRPENGRETLVERLAVKSVTLGTGAFEVEAKEPLEAGEIVRLVAMVEEAGRQQRRVLDEITVAEVETEDLSAVVLQTPREGSRSVSGIVEGDAKSVEIVLKDPLGSKLKVFKQEVTDGEFTVDLSEPLEAGQKISAMPLAPKGPPAVEDVEPVADWGRARATFAFGAILSSENEGFSKTDPYLDFNLDTNWLQRVRKRPSLGRAGAAMQQHPRRGRDELYGRRNFNFFLNSFFDVRLTSIPEEREEPKESAADMGEDGGSDGTNGNGGSNGNGSGDGEENGIDTFLKSRKAVVIQTGIYAPVHWNNFMSWNYKGYRNALFFAPIAKAGLYTPTGNGENQKDLFTFYAGGVRFGHYELGKYDAVPDPARAPKLVSYLDVTWGKWDNIDFKSGGKSRLGLEGRIKIPAIPFRLGIESYLGKGDDDLRFLIDTGFDVGSLLKKLVGN